MTTVIAPMLAETAEAPPSGPEWLYQPKIDGIRCLAHIERHSVRLETRRGVDVTDDFPAVRVQLERVGLRPTVLDGELAVLTGDPPKPSLYRVQRLLGRRGRDVVSVAAGFYVFDVLMAAGVDIRSWTLEERQQALRSMPLSGAHVHLVDSYDDGDVLFRSVVALGWEGIMAKRRASTYVGRRSSAWMKVKP